MAATCHNTEHHKYKLFRKIHYYLIAKNKKLIDPYFVASFKPRVYYYRIKVRGTQSYDIDIASNEF